jgi:hypothetical protein
MTFSYKANRNKRRLNISNPPSPVSLCIMNTSSKINRLAKAKLASPLSLRVLSPPCV